MDEPGASGEWASEAAKEVFAEVAELGAPERRAALDRACGGDAALRAQVGALLESHDRAAAQGFMGTPTAADRLAAQTAAGEGVLSEGPGTRIGPYKLLQLIGEGGFGSVFLAEQQEPMVRRIALKIIKIGMDTRQVIARFEAERQALAMMDHPNIARVLDAGATSTGRPYFVMELVRGDPITQYCDRHALSVQARLELFTQVCHAVQHAHMKGIIHRDLKPSNVLVTVHDGKPVPKVIDFGIAKATISRLTEKTLFTEHRALIGTPEYMSPEQAEMGGTDIDTRSDIYSLGVLLYELLTGVTPLDAKALRSAAFAEMQRIIREDEPAKPSTRLSTLDTLASVAAQRTTEPKRLGALVRGDLDWIVMKCLEKERERRYETANGLAEDVQRHLAGEAVVAAPASRAYRVRKFVRRNRGPVAAAAVIAATLAVAAGVSITFGLAEAKARKAEAGERKKAKAINELIQTALESSDPETGGKQDMLVSDAMMGVVKRLDEGAFKDEPEVEMGLRLTVAKVLDANGNSTQALFAAERALAIAKQLHAGDNPDVASAMSGVAYSLDSIGRSAEALITYEAALNMRQRLFQGDRLEVATNLQNVAFCLQRLGRFAEALAKDQAALEMRRRLFGGDHEDVANSLNNLGADLKALGRYDEALTAHSSALEMEQRLFKGDHPYIADSLTNVAISLQALGHFEEALHRNQEALEMYQRLYKGNHPRVLAALNNAAQCLFMLGRSKEALPKFEALLEMQQRLYRGDNRDIAMVLLNIAACLKALGRPGESLQRCEAALEMNRRLFGGDHLAIARSLCLLADCLDGLGRPADALMRHEAGVEMYQRIFKGDHPELAENLDGLADCLERLGRDEDALQRRREVLAMQRRLLPAGSPEVTFTMARVGAMLVKRGNPAAGAEAEPILRECLENRTTLFPAGHLQQWLRFNTMSMLGGALVAQSKFAEAQPLLVDSYVGLKDDPNVPPAAIAGADRKREALERIVELYEAWDKAGPGKGYDAKAAEWKAKLDAFPLPPDSGSK